MSDETTETNPATPDNIAIVLLGMHRSGSSVLSRALTPWGFAQPRDAVHGRAERQDDPGEPNAIVQLNSRILKELGASWDDPRLLSVRGQSLREGSTAAQIVLRDKYRDHARQAIDASFGDMSQIVLKESRVSLFPELWHAALMDAGFSPRYVLCFRDPVEVTQSVRAHAQLFAPRAHQLWLRYNLAVLAPEPRTRLSGVVSYDALLADGGATLRRIAAALGLAPELPPSAGAALDPAARHFVVTADSTLTGPMLSTATKTLYAVLLNWDRDDPAQRRNFLARAIDAFDEFSLLAGSVIALSPAKPQPAPATPKPPEPAPPVTPRHLLIHYHLFKNAGTSVDAILGKSFGARWINQEFSGRRHDEQQRALTQLLAERADLAALSSHTLLLPRPHIDGVTVVPVLFVRHPLDRLRSAYDFEKKQKADTTGSRLAQETDFAGYLRGRLDVAGDSFCRNFQVHRLAMARPDPNLTETDRAIAMVELLPFIGLVEAFDASITRLQALVAPIFPEFKGFAIHRNATARDTALNDRLDAMEAEIGPDLYRTILDANRGDMELYEMVRAKYR